MTDYNTLALWKKYKAQECFRVQYMDDGTPIVPGIYPTLEGFMDWLVERKGL